MLIFVLSQNNFRIFHTIMQLFVSVAGLQSCGFYYFHYFQLLIMSRCGTARTEISQNFSIPEQNKMAIRPAPCPAPLLCNPT